MKKIFRDVITWALVLTMVVSIIQTNSVLAEETTVDNENLINSLEQLDCIEYTGEVVEYDEEELYNFVATIDLNSLNEEAVKNDLSPMTQDDIYAVFVNGISTVNEQLSDDELTMLSDGVMIDSDDDSFYLQGGSTYDKTYWWGKKRYKSTAAANKWVRQLNKTAAAEGGVGVIAGAVLGVVPGVVGGIGCWYCWSLAADVDYYNGLSKRGIVASIPWAMVGYSVKKQ